MIYTPPPAPASPAASSPSSSGPRRMASHSTNNHMGGMGGELSGKHHIVVQYCVS